MFCACWHCTATSVEAIPDNFWANFYYIVPADAVSGSHRVADGFANFSRFPSDEQQGNLVQLCAELGDDKLKKQVMHVNAVGAVYIKTLAIQERWLNTQTLDDHWVVLCHSAWNAGNLLQNALRDKDKLDQLFVREDAMLYHLDDLESTLRLPAGSWTENVLNSNREFLKLMFKHWSSELEIESKHLFGMCPTGWRTQKHCIMADTETSIATRGALLQNPEYINIGTASTQLELGHKVAKRLNQQCAAIPGDVMKGVTDAVVEATETVAITYAIYTVTTKIPNLKHITTRRDEIDKLKTRISSKGVEFGESLEAHCQSLLKRKKGGDAEDKDEEPAAVDPVEPAAE